MIVNPDDKLIDLAVPAYPTLLWIAHRGARLPSTVVALALLGSAGMAIVSHQPWWLLAGAVVGSITAFLAKLLVEIVRLLVETLIPQ